MDSAAATRDTPLPTSTPAAAEHGEARIRRWARRGPLLPALVFMVVTTQLPMVVTVVVSMFNWNALYPNDIHFVGLDNFVQVFQTDALRGAVVTTIVMTGVVVAASLVLGLGLALLLHRRFWGRGVVRTMLIAPFLMVPIAAALLWKHVLLNPSYGLINGALGWLWSLFGSDSPPQPAWVSTYPMMSIEAALIWQWTPFMMLIILAGLQSLPPDTLEAAQVDGAGPFAVFRYITLPHLRRYLELGALLGSVYIVQNFDAVFTMTSGGLGTANLAYTVYRTFFQAQDYGLASAMGVLVVLASIVIATLALRTVSSLLKEA
ncbi:sugar ABC transporter permease [Phycicoccus endophyticus]|uniref:Sugar ABC transporter permease n=1 Tax=Phycicoccus endophyticus TaxID=1690220 RepID=A0A7G9R1L7_9MICO|nr:sugar ABC transporter permease [Phycicoccus endophyticus]NHI18720.1 sugar ABC transporter permease [Phycicoccus endophyticus]QNN49492.1 sugar ABC transporter permease [Phycicoccus endophyticus]GGL36993.1 sugar ABC transporter permease [Phycicoccus endophyticus]